MFKLGQLLCPPLNHTYRLAGKISSFSYDYLQLVITKCNSSLYSNCIPDAQLALIEKMMGKFIAFVAILNNLVNPGDKDYLKVYLE